MRRVLKVILVISFIVATPSFASNFERLIPPNSNTLLTIVAILLIVLLIALVMIKKLKTIKQKAVNGSNQNSAKEFSYLNDNIEDSIIKLKQLSKELANCSIQDKSFLTDLTNKILLKLKELNIYLNVKSNDIKVEPKNFNLEKFIKGLNLFLCEDNNLKELNIITDTNISYHIIADEKILENIFLLIALHQFKEHNCVDATAHLELLVKSNELRISVSNLELTDEINRIIDNKLDPIYENGRHHGIYLNLLIQLVDRLKGVLEIDLDDDNQKYGLKIKVPVRIEKMDSKYSLLLPHTIKNNKKILIISDNEKIAGSIMNFLEHYNFNTEKIYTSEITKIENLEDYDVLIIDAIILNSLISDYLSTLKDRYKFKIVVITSANKPFVDKDKLVDYTLSKPILQSKIYKMILTLYQYDLDNKDGETKSSSNFKNNRVLIADDERVNLRLLKYLISSYGVEVVTAQDGEEVLDILNRDKNFNLIILDSIMRKLNGYDTIKKIRENEEYNSIPVILHSSLSKEEYSIEDIFSLGFDSYLPKPFTKEKLLSILDRYLQIDNGVEDEIEVSGDKKNLEEFLAIYSNSDKIIEKFIKENRREQAISILKDLKTISSKLKQTHLLDVIERIEKNFNDSKDIDSELIYTLSTTIKNTTTKVVKELGY